jgi:hypothetical protein
MVQRVITRSKWYKIITINDLINDSFNVKACWLNISTDLLINRTIQGTTPCNKLTASAPKDKQQWLKSYFILQWCKWHSGIYWCHESIISIHSSTHNFLRIQPKLEPLILNICPKKHNLPNPKSEWGWSKNVYTTAMPWVKSRATKLNDQVSDSSGNDDSNSGLFLLTTTQQLQRNTDRSFYMPGLYSWKTSLRRNTKSHLQRVLPGS